MKLIMQASHKVISTSIPEIPSLVSLAVIIVVLAGSIILSLKKPLPEEPEAEEVATGDAPIDLEVRS
ncbi:hypothetical protein ACETU7_19815 [Rhodococcus sp. 3Y1]